MGEGKGEGEGEKRNADLIPFSSPSPPAERGLGGKVGSKHKKIR
jgi:hypothetical protein